MASYTRLARVSLDHAIWRDSPSLAPLYTGLLRIDKRAKIGLIYLRHVLASGNIREVLAAAPATA
jgi:hypothetical protein